ncbi:MAG: tetratricopeptide repeat protein [Desulfobacca sp.]|uniref:tetratricopeptide repeat protein n=1 Tax=Desulfobacca sp. TaxID=2067990 RepID=UPI0040490F46
MRRRSLALLAIFSLLWTLRGLFGAYPAATQPHLCTDDLLPPLAAGYAALRAGDAEKARGKFEEVLAVDGFNPYALNNLAVLAERQGKLKEAMAYLLTAETYAAGYCHRLEEICEGGGLCLAVLPSADKGPNSSIVAIIHNNIELLRNKISRSGTPAP